MILVDTSIWVDHFRRGNSKLVQLLEDGEVVSHPFVIGELACGVLEPRQEILSLLAALPLEDVADHDAALALLDARGLHGRGLGWVDVHLLASASQSDARLWTLDKALSRAAASIL